MILSDGITESARKASTWNGVRERGRRAPRAAALIARLAASTSAAAGRRGAPRPAAAARPATPSAVDDDDAAAELDEPGDDAAPSRRRRRRRTTRLCASWATRRAERAALQAEAAHEAEPDAARARGGARGRRSSRGRAPGRRPRSRRRPSASSTSDVGHDLVAGRARSRGPGRPSPGERKVVPARAAGRARCAAPSRARRRGGISPSGCPRFSTSSGTELLEVGQDERRRPGSRARSRRGCASPWYCAGLSEAMTSASSGVHAERDRLAHHRVDVAVVGDVLRLAVVGAEGDALRAVLEHEREQRAAGCGPSTPRGSAARCPARSRSRPSSSRDRLVVGADARGRVGVEPLAERGRARVRRRGGRAGPSRARSRVACDDAGEVHHLGDAEHVLRRSRPSRSPVVSGAARRLERVMPARTTRP